MQILAEGLYFCLKCGVGWDVEDQEINEFYEEKLEDLLKKKKRKGVKKMVAKKTKKFNVRAFDSKIAVLEGKKRPTLLCNVREVRLLIFRELAQIPDEERNKILSQYKKR